MLEVYCSSPQSIVFERTRPWRFWIYVYLHFKRLFDNVAINFNLDT